MTVSVETINQLVDNYSYVIFCNKSRKALIVDPAEPKKIFHFLESKKLSIEGILITHHQSDHVLEK